MIVKIKRKSLEQGTIGLAVIFIVVSILIGVSFTTSYVFGATNITNNTVRVTVNVTNTEPNVTFVVVDDDTASPAGQIDLTANGVTVVTCNATIFDYNGANDIDPNRTNGTFLIQSIGVDSASDNNHLYRNESCGRCTQNSATNVSCDCRFAVQYYANDSSSWICNMTVRDKGGTSQPGFGINLTSSGVSGLVTVTKLLAINTSSLIDYGNLSVSQTSPNIPFNITNGGNINLNLSLRGYGGSNESIGENLSMICDFGNITFGYQRYFIGINGTAFSEMRNLTNKTVMTNFTLPARINDNTFGEDRNTTYWRLNVPLGVGGICNGTIIFGAVDAEG